jgi:uncharacterized protein
VSRFFWWLIVGLAAWWLITRLRREGQVSRPTSPPHPPVPAVPASMVRCAHCGLHLPQSEALLDAAGRSFCSAAHRIAGPG